MELGLLLLYHSKGTSLVQVMGWGDNRRLNLLIIIIFVIALEKETGTVFALLLGLQLVLLILILGFHGQLLILVILEVRNYKIY